MRFDERVRLYADKLNDTDDQIVDYIMEHRDEIADIPIQKMAEALYTVPNTIVRFAKKLGYKGFAELKAALALERRAEAAIKADGKTAIEKTKELIDEQLIEDAVRKLHEAKHVFFYGIGDSAYFCEMMAKHLRCVGKPADFFVQRHDMLYNADRCGEKDVVFVISVSGETKQVLEAVAAAKQNGAFVIRLTHFSPNSLADLADFRLYCWAPKQFLTSFRKKSPTSKRSESGR